MVRKLEGADQGRQEGGAGSNCWGDGKEGSKGAENLLEHRIYHNFKFGSITFGTIPVGLQRCGNTDVAPHFSQ
jgi:hypothetical protein